MYNYKYFRQWATTDEGAQVRLIQMRDRAGNLFREAGCAMIGKLMGSGDCWENFALVDRLVELGDVQLLSRPDSSRHGTVVLPLGDWWWR